MTHIRMNRLPFGHVLDQLITDAFDQVVVPAVRGTFQRPASNIIEEAKGFRIEMLAPGFGKEDLKISLDKNVLTVFAQKEATAQKEGTDQTEAIPNFRHREFQAQKLERSFTLPDTVDQSAIEATMENGVLQIFLPKKAEILVEPKTISIS